MKGFTPLIFTFIFLLWSCSSNTNQSQETTNTTEADAPTNTAQMAALTRDPRTMGPAKPAAQYQIEENIYKINAAEDARYGYWIGAFGKNKINIAIAHIAEDSIYGHSVCAGNFRPIKGTITAKPDGLFEVVMREPGDDQYDGLFEFTMNPSEGQLEGKWAPYQNSTSTKTYSLTKRPFKYDGNVGDFPQASARYLELHEVENLLPEDIEIIRNEIYARHGYSFKNIKIRRVFDAKDWYMPMAIDIRDQLTEIEAHNIDLLYNYEEYYEDYYDDFGR